MRIIKVIVDDSVSMLLRVELVNCVPQVTAWKATNRLDGSTIANSDEDVDLPSNRQSAGRCFGSVLPEMGAGDVVAAATKAVGIRPCEPCRKRQEAMNRATPGWAKRMIGKIMGG